MLRELIHANPEIAAVVVLVLGLALARLADFSIRRLVDTSNQLARRFGSDDRDLVSPAFRQVFSLGMALTVIAFTIILAIRILDLPQLTSRLESILAYAPRLILGLFIIGMGNILGSLLRNLSANLLANGDRHSLLPRLVQIGVITIAIITGLEQLGVDISFVTRLLLIVLAALLGGLSLAFAFGAREHVANLVAGHELGRYSIGDHLRIDQYEGTVTDIHRTGIVLSTKDGRVNIPASQLACVAVLQFPAGTERNEPTPGD